MRKQKILIEILLVVTIFIFGCVSAGASEDTWAVYLYLCGSDLESEGGAATNDIAEILDAELSDDLTVVIESGGSNVWQNETMDAEYIERYIYNSEDFYFDEQVELANMGDSSTLADFLQYCHTYYPADHEVLIFWNHGGGSKTGVAYDEIFDYDYLSLAEIHDAFESVYELSSDNPPLELIGFDACLMSTIDTAKSFQDIASYMVASEELEPETGWNYGVFLQALSDDPFMDGAELGTVICDSFIEGCDSDDAKQVTLSVTDLSKIDAVVDAFEQVGYEALNNQTDNQSFFTEFARNANASENYGGNTPEAGYSNYVDLGDLMLQNADVIPDSYQQVIDALEDCVVYQVKGDYRKEANGLSCYFPYEKNEEDFQLYQESSVTPVMTGFYSYGMYGTLTDEQESYLSSFDIVPEHLLQVQTFEYLEPESSDLPVYIDDDGYAVLVVEPDILNAISGVYFELSIMDQEEDFTVWLGSDNNIDMDWENGIFRDNFTNTWGCLDGHLCYMKIAYEGPDYNLYLVPILLNGRECQLHVVYDYNTDCYEILGAREGIEDNGMSNRNLIKLKPGDIICTRVYGSSISGEDEMELIEIDEFEVTENTSFTDEKMGDGQFVMSFELIDCQNESVFSEPVIFTVEDGNITAEV